VLNGISRGSADLTFVYDLANKPTVAPYSLIPGTYQLADFLPDGTDDFTMPVLIKSLKWTGGPKAGAVRCTVNMKSNGPYVLPTS
jgi:hypothetical protein